MVPTKNNNLDINSPLLTDLYEFSMANGYLKNNVKEKGGFDLFFRKVPDQGSFVISAGLELIIQSLKNFHFTVSDLKYLSSLNVFSKEFIKYLKNLKFNCDVWSVPEGTPIFPQEPVITVFGPLIQAQLLETLILNSFNHQSLIATKSRRMSYAAQGRPIMEFGSRRAQGQSAAIWGARSAVIGGCSSTSDVEAAKKFHLKPAGTMAHSWIEAFPDELTAFRKWAKAYPNNVSLLVDTYNVINSGLPNAIKVFSELKQRGHHNFSIRIDSGDLSALAKKARAILDKAGFPDVKITVSSGIDESVIQSLLAEKAPVDNFGIGENLITSFSSPVLSGVYKLSLIEKNNQRLPKMKISDSQSKLTLPGLKTFYRLYRKDDPSSAFADLIALKDEKINSEIEIINADPLSTDKRSTLKNFIVKRMPCNIFNKGKLVYKNPSVHNIKKHLDKKLKELPAETQRLKKPSFYPVYLTNKLAKVQEKFLRDNKKEK